MSRTMRFITFALIAFLLLISFSLSAPTAHAQPPSTGFLVNYYNGKSLQGPAIHSSIVPVINWSHDTGGSPVPGTVPSTNFSARWEGWYYMDRAGRWTFTMTSDDGSRVWVDNEQIVDMWYDHAPLTRARTRELTAGYHLIRVEYFQNTGGMTAQLTITPPGVFPDWMGEYFDNPYLIGAPRFRVNNVDINFNWGTAGPDPRVPADNFSVRWTRQFTFAPGTYQFTATADDGVRVWVGDFLIIDKWFPQPPTTYTATVTLDGTFPMRVEYFDQSAGAVVVFTWKLVNQPPPPPPAGPNWRGKYFSNPTLTPPPACERDDPILAFNWGTSGPGCGIPGQYFSVRWDSTQNAPTTGFYTIYLMVDDGARIFLDNTLILDSWREQAPESLSTTVYLNAGPHAWRVEYFQASGAAQINLQIVAGVNPPPPPPPPPPPTGDIIVDALGEGWTQGGDPSAWREAPNGYEDSAIWTPNRAFLEQGYNWGRWYPQLYEARNYEVLVYIPGGIATTQNARYWISHAGHYELVVRPQASFTNEWVSLGTFYFTGQGSEYVSLSDVTYECAACTTVVWDAIKFSPR